MSNPTGTVPLPPARQLSKPNQLHWPSTVEQPERHGAFPFRISFPLYGTLLGAAFGLSFRPLAVTKCVAGSQLRLALIPPKASIEVEPISPRFDA